MRNTQREKRAEAKKFLSRFEGGWLDRAIELEVTPGGYTTGGYGDYIRWRENINKKKIADQISARESIGKVLDDTKDQKNNTKFNWKNPTDSDLLRIVIALNVLLILINLLRR